MPRCFAHLAVTVAVLTVVTARADAQDVRRDDRPAAPVTAPKLTKPPQVIASAEPEYPAQASATGLTADVTVRVAIDDQGTPTRAHVVTPVGHGFDEAAIAAALRYRFSPAELDGKPAAIAIELTIHFVLVLAPPADTSGPDVGDQAKGAPAPDPATLTSVRGLVKERGTRRKLSGVAVAIVAAGPPPQRAVETTTDQDGAFVLDGLTAGSYRLIVLAPGYVRFAETLALAAGPPAEKTVYLRRQGASPYETVVEGAREKVEVTRYTLTRQQLTSVPGTFGDPIRVLPNLPGIQRSPFATGFLLIRGTNPDDSGVYVDGHRVPNLYHFLGGPSILNPEFLEQINLYPGGFPARYGRALGGVVEIETRPTKSDGVHGAADVDFLDAGVYMRAPLGKNVAVAAAGRRSYIDALLPLVLPKPSAGQTLVVVPVYWDYQAKVDVNVGARDHLSVLAFGSDDRLDVLASNAEEQTTFDLGTHIGFHRVRVGYDTPIGKDLVLSLSQAFGRDVVAFSGGDRSALDATQWVTSVRERVKGSLSPSLRIDTGIDLEYRVTQYSLTAAVTDSIPQNQNIDLPVSELSANVDSYQLALYAEAAWDVLPTVRLIPGLRFDTYLMSGEPRATLDPRLVVRWRVAKPTTLKSYVGLFHKSPEPEAFDSRFGNPKLGIESALQTGLGVEHALSHNISVEGEVYYANRQDQASFTQEVEFLPDGTVQPLFWKNQAHGDTVGLDLLVRHEITKNFYGWLAYTLARSTLQRKPDEATTPTFFDQTHNLTLVASYRTDGNWEFGGRYRLVTGRPETPVLGGTYDADNDIYVPFTGPRLSGRRPLFHQLDVRAEKTWVFDTWMIAGYLDITNVYNATNPEATQYDYRFRDQAPVRGVPIVPTLGIRGQW